METITKVINTETSVCFDIANSDHGNSGMQWYYGTLTHKDIDYDFSICVMHQTVNESFSTELTFTEGDSQNGVNLADFITPIENVFDWSEINDQHEANEIDLNKTMDKIRNENF